jgi:acetyltransferase-like isoleucine patch superfamily enzyme
MNPSLIRATRWLWPLAKGRFDTCEVHRTAWVSPLQIRGGVDCVLSIADGCLIQARLAFEQPHARIVIGSDSYIGNSSIIAAQSVTIGSNVLVSWGCTIIDHNSHPTSAELRTKDVADWRAGRKDWSNVAKAPIELKDHCWLGFNSIILKGVTVGEGAIVGAGSVVTKDVAPYSAVGGNPAKVIVEDLGGPSDARRIEVAAQLGAGPTAA